MAPGPTQFQNRHDRKRPHAHSPRGRAIPFPRTGEPSGHPGDRGCPGRQARGFPAGRREAGSSGPEAALASSGHFLPGYQPHGAVFRLVLISAPSASASTRLEPGESRGHVHVPQCTRGPRACPSHAHQPRGLQQGSGSQFWGAGSRRVASLVTPADAEHGGRAGPQTWRLGTLRPPGAPRGLGLWELNGGAEAGPQEGGGRRREWEAGVSQRLRTRDGEKLSQQFPMEKAASPPGARAGPAEPPDLLRAGIPTPLGRGGPPGGSLERPGLPTFLPLTTLPQLAPAPFPVTAPPQERESRAPEKCWLQPGSYSSCAQLAGASPDLRVDGRQVGDFYLPGVALAEPGESCCQKQPEGPGRGEGGRGLALPRLSLGSLCRQR